MNIEMDKETTKAWEGWVVFTKFATLGIVVVTVVLGLMALFLL